MQFAARQGVGKQGPGNRNQRGERRLAENAAQRFAPSFLIGGVAENFGTSFHVEEGTRPFILEGDEYDTAFFDKGPKFLHYFPDVALC